jgi:exodeoxyribonuclease-3
VPDLLTLNVARPTRERVPALLEWLWHQPEELLVLTEVAPGGGSDLIAEVCRAAGHQVFDSRQSAAGDYGVLLVARQGTWEPAPDVVLPPSFPGRAVAVRKQGLLVIGVYGAASDPVRYSSATQRQRKRDWLAELDSSLTELGPGEPYVLIGDLNVVAPGHLGALPYTLAEESAFYTRLGNVHGLVDAHGVDAEVSWVDHSGVGCRFDHAFISADLATASVRCTLDHTPRTTGLTDHSALRLHL